MTTGYIVLGAILIAMGITQTYLRHGPEGRRLRAEQEAVRERRMRDAEAVRAEMEDEEETADEDRGDGGGAAADRRRSWEADQKAFKRSNRVWTGWTGILGGVGIAFGIVLVVLGLLGY